VFVVFQKVFSKIQYIALVFLTSTIIFLFAVWLPNLKLISRIIINSNLSILEKINFLFSMLGSIKTNFTFVSASYTIAIAILFGINISLLIYYIKIRRVSIVGSNTTLSLGGLVSGIFGIGCAACGTFILSSFLGFFGVAGILTYLPFGGEEFGFIGVGLLIYSIYSVSQKINSPLVCKI
jgi:hypothetical protein